MGEARAFDHAGSSDLVLRALSDAVRTISAQGSLEPVLQKLVDAARDLAAAQYGALGVPDGEGGFSQFVVSGISEAKQRAIGYLPRTHGLLGAAVSEPTPFRVDDISADPRFQGWPDAHPHMRSMLGVPILSKGSVIGALYLTDKRGHHSFSREDQALVEMLAAHAAVAIEMARLHQRNQELSVMEERNRLARDLHDALAQTLFSISFTAEAAATLLDRDPDRARDELRRVGELASSAAAEMRSLVFELRPAELEADGLVATLQSHIEVLRRVYGVAIEFRAGLDQRLAPDVELAMFRIGQEAVQNALRHGHPTAITVRLGRRAGAAFLEVRDDGVGFDPADRALRSQHLGLTTMRERADAVGGSLATRSRHGAGTTVTVEVPLAG